MNTYYVCLQTGLIKENPSSFTNFKEWKVKLTEEQKQEFEAILITNDVKKQYEFMQDKLILNPDKTEVKRILFKSR